MLPQGVPNVVPPYAHVKDCEKVVEGHKPKIEHRDLVSLIENINETNLE